MLFLTSLFTTVISIFLFLLQRIRIEEARKVYTNCTSDYTIRRDERRGEEAIRKLTL